MLVDWLLDLWGRLIGRHRVARCMSAEFGPPPGARYREVLAGMSDDEILRLGTPREFARWMDPEVFARHAAWREFARKRATRTATHPRSRRLRAVSDAANGSA